MEQISPFEITPEHLYLSRHTFLSRRKFLTGISTLVASALVFGACKRQDFLSSLGPTDNTDTPEPTPAGADEPEITNSSELVQAATDELGDELTPYDSIVNYNNFYEFSVEKEDVAHLARDFKTSPWTVEVGGLVNKPQAFGIEDLQQKFGQEERIYRMRCVEGWDMVIAWLGSPIRLVVPWKYGFKSIKSIVKIDLVEKMPTSLWMAAAPREYGFYSNVNPDVHHPRWSQASERRIGELGRRKTLLFNGYAEEVAYLYEGMDLRKSF